MTASTPGILAWTHLSVLTINISGFPALLSPQGNIFICNHLLSFLGLRGRRETYSILPWPLGVEDVGRSRAFFNHGQLVCPQVR